MKDKLGRKIKDYDLVLGMIVSRDSDGMRFGVSYGDSVYWENGIKSAPRNIYLIDNPCEKEIEIKNKILKVIEEYNKVRDEKRNIKYLKAGDYKVGHIYETTEGLKFAYLGKGHLITSMTSWNGRVEHKEFDGFLYMRINTILGSLKSEAFDSCQYICSSFSGTKSRKKFVRDTGDKIDIIDKYCIIQSNWKSFGRKMYERAIIELF